MVNVYTKNGNFNISESLMKAIKVNNPELLLERKKKISDDEMEHERKIAKDKIENKIHMIQLTADDYIKDIPQSQLNDEDAETLKDYLINYGIINFLKNDLKDIPTELKKKYYNSKNKAQKVIMNKDADFPRLEKDFQGFYNNNVYRLHDIKRQRGLEKLSADEDKITQDDIAYQNEKQREEQQKAIDKQMRKHHVVDSDDQILFQQILLNGGDISKGIEIDGKKLSQKQIERRIKRNPYFQQAWNEFEKDKYSQEELKSNKVTLDKQKENKKIKSLNDDYSPETLEDLLNSQGLIDEINMTESAAKKLVETSKECISDILGLLGNSERNNSSNLVKNTFNDKKTNNANDNSSAQQNLKKAVGEAVNTSTSAISDTNFNTSNIANDNKMSKNNDLLYKPKATGASRFAKGAAALVTGGFNIEPLFSGNPSDKKPFGMAMKYYKEYTKSKNNNSLIDNLMDYLLEKHSNNNGFEKHIKEQLVSKYGKLSNNELKNKFENLSKDLDRISANFLGNVVYRLKVGNDNTFNEIMRAVRFAPKIKEKYYVSNESKLQMFGVREQALIFKNINSESVVSIFVATPLLARATELGKQALKLTRHFKNIKA